MRNSESVFSLPVLSSQILQLIPQRPPFVMVDELLQCDEKSGTTSFVIQAQNVLCDESGNFREAGLLENIAQTAAARSGFLFRRNGQQPPVGFIGAMSRVEVLCLPKAGDRIETTITEVAEAMGMTLIKGEVKMNKEAIAQCEMKIFLNPEIPQQ